MVRNYGLHDHVNILIGMKDSYGNGGDPRFLGAGSSAERPISSVSNASTMVNGNPPNSYDINDPSTPSVPSTLEFGALHRFAHWTENLILTFHRFMPKDHFESQPLSQINSYHVLGADGRSPSPVDQSPFKSGPTSSASPASAAEIQRRRRRHRMIGGIALGVLILLAVAIILGVVLGTRSKTTESVDGSSAAVVSAASKSGGASTGGKLWGVGGDTITVSISNRFG